MKKNRLFSVLAVLCLFALILSACSGRQMLPAEKNYANDYGGEQVAAPDSMVRDSESKVSYTVTSSGGKEEVAAPVTGEKLIKTLSLRVETLDFEKSVEAVRQQTAALGGYVENSTVDDYSYNSRSGYRHATFVLRIPADALPQFEKDSEAIGKVTSRTENVQNVTLSYSDLESRIQALTIQRDRLMDMLRESKDVGEMLTIQDHLSEVEYKLESYGSQLRVMENQISYSTVNLTLSEVRIYSEPEPETFWQRLGSTFKDSLEAVGEFFEDLGLFLFGRLPQILIFALIVFVAVVIIRKLLKKGKAKRQAEAVKYAQLREEAAQTQNKKDE